MVLVAHPMLTGALHRALILLLEHGENGSYGIVINRPTQHTLGSAVKNLPADFSNKFGKMKVGFGGLVRRMQFVHSISSCGGVKIPYCNDAVDLFAGGSLAAAMSHVKHNPSDANKFRFFVGCCCWEPRKLGKEIDVGYWIPVKSQPDLLLRCSESATTTAEEDGNERRALRQGTMAADDQWDLYGALLRSLGDEFKGLLDIPHWLDSSSLEACN